MCSVATAGVTVLIGHFVILLSSHSLLVENSCFTVRCPVTTVRNTSEKLVIQESKEEK